MSTKELLKSKEQIAGIQQKYPDFFVELLLARGLDNEDKIKKFLNPNYDRDLHDPSLLKNIKKASDRVWQAIEKKEKILIYGDYDCDGICASAILHEFFDTVGYGHDVYMPDRMHEGHGLNQKAIEKFVSDEIDLIITLDCGTTNYKEIEYAQKNGVDVIVVDHHLALNGVPPAYAFVNPHQEGDEYLFEGLCGAGLAFKFFLVLSRDGRAKRIKFKNKEKWMLDLVALATVADVAPLLGENRVLVKYGLVVLAQTKNIGLRELFPVAGIKPNFDKVNLRTNLDTITIGFALGPRINAASRMAHATLGYELLTTKDTVRASTLALELEENNRKRQNEVEYVRQRLREQIEKKSLPEFIVESSSQWSITILGLIASRVMDEYMRPVMLINEQGDVSKASFRAPKGFDLMEALDSASSLLIQYGGHAAAAGCSLQTKNIEAVRQRLNEYVAQNPLDKNYLNSMKADSEVFANDITLENAELIESLAPFGMGNSQPKLQLKNLCLTDIRELGNGGKHAKLWFKDREANKGIEALYFFHNGDINNLHIGGSYNIVGELSVNEYNGIRSSQFKILNIRSMKHEARGKTSPLST